ncbi:MAG: NlpC/P60 family protein [Litoreibacter sp.]|uniref:NlpC/P60 family protein n=1 Tax=Litoreibacter sp. TaxID=1969459 RepID=UPI00329A495E
MSTLAEDMVAEAHTWIGTPYRHQASCKGAGADCLGLLRGVWRAMYGDEPEQVPAYSPDWSEPQGEERLWAAAKRRLVAKPVGEEALGDVVLFRMREQGVAKHLGIVSALGGTPKFIHAYSGHGVVESPFSEPWARRVVARFKFPKAGS